MKSLFFTLSLLFILIVCACSDGKPSKLAKECYLSLKKIEAKTEIGVNYFEYMHSLSDAKLSVNLFLESSEAIKTSAINDSIKKTMGYYIIAGEMMALKAKGFKGSLPPNDELIIKIKDINPKLIESNVKSLYIDDGIQLLWGEASIELKNISKFF